MLMSLFKSAVLALVAITTSSVLLLVSSESSTAHAVSNDNTRFVVSTAEKFHKALTRRHARDRLVQGKAKARRLTDIRRIKRLPQRLTAPIVSLDDKDKNRRLDSHRISFRAGTNDQAVCLNIRTGRVIDGLCGTRGSKPRQSVVGAYKTLVTTTIWFDKRHRVYGKTARDIALVRHIAATELSGYTVQYVDADDDGLVDGGHVTLANETTGECATVTLPDHLDHRATMLTC